MDKDLANTVINNFLQLANSAYEEMPNFIKEFLEFKELIHTVGFSIAATLLTIAIIVLLLGLYGKIKLSNYDCITAAGVYIIFAGIPSLITVLIEGYTLAMIKLAPKLYLIEYVTGAGK